ncbi:SDR family oxidoreductase [uncultured Croceitalea sp.]|uniref:SDR family oxidoreductase n=1 Tax=uncultured Croceitalea sp. TaxID=1798908 RepID=UPI003305C615
MKTVLITGSSNGFGYLTALTLARYGFKVWASMREPNKKNKIKNEELRSLANTENLDLHVVELDVTNDTSVTALAAQFKDQGEHLDVLINNAGVMYVGITEAYSIAQVQEQFDTNFFGIVRTTKAFLPFLKMADDGLVINISSLAGRLVFPYFGVYCSSKFALEAYSEALRYELKPFGVGVSIIEPGPFASGLLYSGPKEEDDAVLQTYGEMSGVPAAMLKSFGEFYQTEDALDPQLVPDDVLKLIVAPKESRPIRQVTGIDYGTVEFNERTSTVQKNLIENILQMQHLV